MNAIALKMTAQQWIECKRRLVDFGYTPAEANAWMESPHPLLNHKTAAASDYSDVVAIIDQLESGAFL